MTVRHVKDVVLFGLTAAEMRQVMEEPGMICTIWKALMSDLGEAVRTGRWVPWRLPLKICHEEQGRGHVLQCRVDLWPYFREVEASNPFEREIRSEMLSLGLSGEADRRTARYGPS